MSLAEDVELEEFITMKDDLSGADIKAVCTEAGLLALRERRMRVTKADFTEAREKVSSESVAAWRHRWYMDMYSSWFAHYRYCIGRTRAHPKVFICNVSIRQCIVCLLPLYDLFAIFVRTATRRLWEAV